MDLSRGIENLEGEEYIEEKTTRQDMENLTPEDVLKALYDTIDKDTTIDMITENIEQAVWSIERYKFDRIQDLLDMKRSWDFIEEQKRKKELMEVET